MSKTTTTTGPDTCFMCEHVVIAGYCDCNVGQDVEAAVREPQLLEVNSEHYILDSFTHPGIQYDLKRNEYGDWLCACPAYTFHMECKHCAYLLDHLGETVVTRPLPPMHVLTTPTEVLAPRSTEMDMSDNPLVRLFVANGR